MVGPKPCFKTQQDQPVEPVEPSIGHAYGLDTAFEPFYL